MAMSGGTSYLVRSKYADYGNKDWTTDLYVYVKLISQDKINNKSKISLGMYVYSKYEIDWTDHGTNGTSYVGIATSGENCFTFTKGRSGSGTYWLTENHEVTVTHKSDGTLILPIYWHWGVNSAWGQYQGPSGSVSVTLPTIDRTAPTVSVSISNITVNSIYINATSNVNCDVWEYSLDGGSTWVQYSTISGTSTTKTISGLTPDTEYSVQVRARKRTNYVKGASDVRSVKTLGGTSINSVNTLIIDAVSPIIQMNWTVYNASYTHKLVIKNETAEILTIEGLTASVGTINKTYALTAAQREVILNEMVNMAFFVATYELYCYDGSVQIGQTATCQAVIQTTSENSKPTFARFDFLDINEVTCSLTGNAKLMVQHHSYLRVICANAVAQNGSSIANYKVTIGAKTVTSATTTVDFGEISISGPVTMTVSAIDTRGYTATKSRVITILPYERVEINYWSIRRINEVEEVTDFTFEGTYSPLAVEGSDRNLLENCTYRYRSTSSDEWSEEISIPLTALSNSFWYSNGSFGQFDAEYSYEICLCVRDRITSCEVYLSLPKGTPLVSYRSKKVGINNNDPTSALDVVGEIKQNGEGVLGMVGVLSADFNTIITGGIYWYAAEPPLDNAPSTECGFLLVLSCSANITHLFTDGVNLYMRSYNLSTSEWDPWEKK